MNSRIRLVVHAFTFSALVVLSSAVAQTGVPLWTNRYEVTGPGLVQAAALAVDRVGSVYVAGNYSNGTNADYFTIKYSNVGVPLWTNHYDGGRDDYAARIAVDKSGNAFVTGLSYSTNGDLDYGTVGYSSAGKLLWTNRYTGPVVGGDEARAITTDESGNVYVTGASIISNGYPNYDYATIKYSGTGEPLWTNIYNGLGNGTDSAQAISADASGNVYATGYSHAASGFSSANYATIKYSNTGLPLWTNTYDGLGNDTDEPAAMVLDSAGNVIVTGYAATTGAPWYDFAYATIKYTATGLPLWTNLYNEPGNLGSFPKAIATDADGNIFVTGYSHTNPYPDYATVGYSSAGAPLWTNRYNGSDLGFGVANAIATDRNGKVFVTGYSSRGSNSNDYVTIEYSNSGLPLSTNIYGGPENYDDQASAIAVDDSGNVFVTGFSNSGTNSGSAFVTIKYSFVQPTLLVIRPQGNYVVLNWANAMFNLQSAPAVSGTFTNIPGATSPYTNPITGAQQFFRLKAN